MPVLIFLAVSAYSLRWIRSFATDLYFPNQWQDIFGIFFLGILMFLLYVYVNKLVKMTGGIIRWKYEGGIYLPWFEIIWISMISNDSLTPYNIHLSVTEYMFIHVVQMQNSCSSVKLRAMYNGYNSTPGLQIFVQWPLKFILAKDCKQLKKKNASWKFSAIRKRWFIQTKMNHFRPDWQIF